MPTSLNRARNKKNDEFYTRMLDIEEEMSHYDFTNKIIYCNCDNPATSNFYKFFRSNFDTLKLKKLIVTCLLTKQKVEYYGQDNLKVSYLNSYGDFRSADCLSALKEADCIVTNPPFSLFREFISLLIHNNKQFLVLGNINAVTYKEIFNLIMKNKIWLGYRQLNKDMYFDVPDGVQNWLIKNKKEGSAYKVVNNKVMGRLASACWFTNIDHSKRHREINTAYIYNESYAKYDNYNIINVDKLKEISMDYNGIMGVPITYMAIHNPEQYDILGIANSARYIGQECVTKINGKKIYNRILIKKRPAS